MTNRHWVLLLVLAISLVVAVRSQANPWQKLLPFKKVEADPGKSYSLTDADGPWMILATVFRGDDAERQAQQLVFELRKKFKLEAYTHVQVFDHTTYGRARGFNPDGSPSVRWQARESDVKEIAVLVGNFGSIDDDRATDTLKKVKTIEPEALRTDPRKSSQVFAGLRQAMHTKKKKGPMGSAFVVTNPLLPPEYFNSPGLDKLVLEMNEEVPHSLLNCPGKYTVRVARFTGTSVIDQRKIRDTLRSGSIKHSLQEAAENAHLLTEELRRRGHDAYEFHDQDDSIVCVGSFDRLTFPGPNGQQFPNPQIDRYLQLFGAQSSAGLGAVVSQLSDAEVARRKTLVGDKYWALLEIRPKAIEVPKAPLSAAYRR
ncbi:MAG: hypothetical protein WD894_24860 [Pirellulales bacterium]